ncbi:stage III sporulation protein AG [Bacillus sp. V2I10]|uniref:stage III sporulation protein AG n=1 Tax=Bacillus sp. V2I10 TaxID=3042276 RepID=UPI002781A293|nr:stage III sporulation protein AG [Bacillus sp. V2I10]MDQ0858443.1 stage III sporulation protein AG [Bacillus sp. V2I10]
MSNPKNLLEKLKSMLNTENGKKPTKYHYVLIVLALGIGFMLVSNLFTNETNLPKVSQVSGLTSSTEKDADVFKPSDESGGSGSIDKYEQEYENQLKEALDSMIGIENALVVVNVDATSEQILEKNSVTQSQTTEETDPQGGKRTVEDGSTEESVVIIRKGEQETPIILQTKKPEIRGVLVVAAGADNIQIKKSIVEAVTRVLGVPSHRVAVSAKKGK